MKLKIKDLRKIIKEAVKEHGLDGFRKSEGFKAQLEAIMNTLSEFSSKTPVGFFDAYNKEFDVDFYKTFHDFHETVGEAYNNLYGSPGAAEVHVGNVKPAQTAEEGEEDTANVEQKIGESVAYRGAEPDLDSWSKKKIEDYWDTFKKNYKSEEAKLSAASTFTSNPEQFLLDLEARATKVKEDRE